MSANHSEVFKLKGVEVAAIFSLGQMHNKIVKLTDSMWKKTTVGLFYIDHINENHDLSFSNASDWQTVKIDSISMHLIIPNEYGQTTMVYNHFSEIEGIALLMQ
jgi:hypothetical protein